MAKKKYSAKRLSEVAQVDELQLQALLSGRTGNASDRPAVLWRISRHLGLTGYRLFELAKITGTVDPKT